jgi:hypothetical protein
MTSRTPPPDPGSFARRAVRQQSGTARPVRRLVAWADRIDGCIPWVLVPPLPGTPESDRFSDLLDRGERLTGWVEPPEMPVSVGHPKPPRRPAGQVVVTRTL